MVITSFIKYILGYVKNKSNKGLLGRVRAYYSIVEAQFKGTLHLHMLLWLIDSINPLEFKKRLTDEPFIKKLITYLDSIISNDFTKLNKTKVIDEIYPLCRSIDYINKEKIDLDKFLNDVHECVSNTQIHKCTFTCFKSGTKCRFGFQSALKKIGKELIQLTWVDKHTGKINLKRLNRLVNSFNEIMESNT